jgi:hypothetical protein
LREIRNGYRCNEEDAAKRLLTFAALAGLISAVICLWLSAKTGAGRNGLTLSEVTDCR